MHDNDSMTTAHPFLTWFHIIQVFVRQILNQQARGTRSQMVCQPAMARPLGHNAITDACPLKRLPYPLAPAVLYFDSSRQVARRNDAGTVSP